jgi:hypothetical protein
MFRENLHMSRGWIPVVENPMGHAKTIAKPPASTPYAALSLLESEFLSTLLSLQHRYSKYLTTEICSDISEHDDMFVSGKLVRYLSGRSAIDIIVQAKLSAKMDHFSSLLDLRCGGGRVTRHLKAFLPDAQALRRRPRQTKLGLCNCEVRSNRDRSAGRFQRCSEPSLRSDLRRIPSDSPRPKPICASNTLVCRRLDT